MARVAGPRLAFELHEVQFGDAAVGPQVGRQTNVGQRVAVEIKRQALDAAGAEIPAGDDGVTIQATERFRHDSWLRP